MNVFDLQPPGVLPEYRSILEMDLAGHSDREEFAVETFPDMALLSKSEAATGVGLERRAAQTAVEDLLSTPESSSLEALREELRKKNSFNFKGPSWLN